jgi:hypothetical protein
VTFMWVTFMPFPPATALVPQSFDVLQSEI